jgi:hypothetical protein
LQFAADEFVTGYALHSFIGTTKADRLCVNNPDSSIYF